MSIPDPVVLLDARAKYVHPALQMTRASTKAVFDSAGRLVTAPANAIGWSHDPATGESRGYAAESAATNLFLRSNELSHVVWSLVQASITPAAAVGPDGDGMAKLVENAANTQHYITQTCSFAAGSIVSMSVIARAAERHWLQLQSVDDSNTTNSVYMTGGLDGSGAVAAGANGSAQLTDAGVDDLGGGFYRLWVSGTFAPGVAAARCRTHLLASSSGGLAYQGDGASGAYLGYMQFETGDAPSSYVATAAATAIRARDSLLMPNLSQFPWWRWDAGTVMLEMIVPHQRSLGDILSLSGSALALRGGASRDILFASTQVGVSRTIVGNSEGRHRIAVAWSSDGVAVAADGGLEYTSAVPVALPQAAGLGLGIRSTELGQSADADILRAVYLPQRVPNAALQSLTAIQE